jgi:hypothetical protein
MIDLVSTRPGTDKPTATCCHLLTAVIALAIKDLCRPPNAREKKGAPIALEEMDFLALDAIQFLFGKTSVFSHYAELIGTTADDVRRALIKGEIRQGYELRDKDFRIFNARLRWCGIEGTGDIDLVTVAQIRKERKIKARSDQRKGIIG